MRHNFNSLSIYKCLSIVSSEVKFLKLLDNLFKTFFNESTSFTKYKLVALVTAGIGKEVNEIRDIVCLFFTTDSSKTDEPFAV